MDLKDPIAEIFFEAADVFARWVERGGSYFCMAFATGHVELIAPVDNDGLVTPSPFTKILTAEPGAAGLAQPFTDPSGLRASACTPE